MKTILLASIIAVIGISLTVLVFIYQHIQNCETEGGSLTGFLTCGKSEYKLISELFEKKYGPVQGRIIDGVKGSTIELVSKDPHGNSVTLIIKEKQNGPYYAEIICQHKTLGKTERITDDVIGYLQNENCFLPMQEKIAGNKTNDTFISGELIPANSWDDIETFAQTIIKITDDTIIEKRIDDENRSVYTTEKGNLVISKDNSLEYSRLVDYSLDGKYAIPKENATKFVDNFLDKIGYQRDGSEWIENTDYGSYLKIQFQQRKDGWIINNEITQFTFWPENTYIYLGRWYTDLDSVEIKYSQDDAKQIAYDYIQEESKTNTEMLECGFKPSFPEYAQMEIIYDELAYVVSGGGCSIEAWEGHYPWIQVMVDAVDGSVIGWRYGPLE